MSNQCPNGWNSTTLLDVSEKVKAGPFGSAITKSMYVADGFKVYGQEQVIAGDISIGSYFISEEKFEELSSFSVQEGDILMSCVGTFGKTLLVPEKHKQGIINPRLILVRLKDDFCPLFVQYLLSSSLVQDQLLSCLGGGTMGVINATMLKRLSLRTPPLPEQKKIAEILSGIDILVSAEQRKRLKISLMRSSTITKFTRYGLAKSLFRNTSIGKIPEDWRVCTLGEVFVRYSYGPRFSAKDYSSSGNVRTIRGTDVSASTGIRYSQVPLAKLDEKLVSSHSLSDGDVVMITTADCGLTSVFREQEIPFICSAYAVRFTPGKMINPDYFALFMQSELALRQVDSFTRKGTVANLPGSDVMKIKLPLPGIDEQNKIVQIIRSIDHQIKFIDNQIDSHKSLQKSLSTDLLSGRKRVSI